MISLPERSRNSTLVDQTNSSRSLSSHLVLFLNLPFFQQHRIPAVLLFTQYRSTNYVSDNLLRKNHGNNRFLFQPSSHPPYELQANPIESALLLIQFLMKKEFPRESTQHWDMICIDLHLSIGLLSQVFHHLENYIRAC